MLGLFPKNTGRATIALRRDAYTNPSDKNEFSGTGGLNEMWGFVGAMSHCIASEDKDALFVNIKLTGSTVKNVIIAKLITLYEFCHTDIPLLYMAPRMIAFQFAKIDKSDRLSELYGKTKDLFRKIHRKKSDMKGLNEILNESNITATGTQMEVDLTQSPGSVTPPVRRREVRGRNGPLPILPNDDEITWESLSKR